MRKIITFLVVGIVIFLILIAIDHSYVSMNKYISELSPAANMERLKIILLSLCLGIVFDWSNVIKIIQKKIIINYSLVFPFLISLFFALLTVFFIDSEPSFFTNIFMKLHVNIIFGILSGILLTRIFVKNEY
ncbi:Uncharacterised protein [Actinobacillus pleuropneumoniae]|nr:Uncharacterised protein [Actinobacillus pleuropneumoniae]